MRARVLAPAMVVLDVIEPLAVIVRYKGVEKRRLGAPRSPRVLSRVLLLKGTLLAGTRVP